MNDAETTYQQPVNTFLAITRKADGESKIVLTEAEWAIVKEMRRIKNEMQHWQILISFAEERFMLYNASLSNTLERNTIDEEMKHIQREARHSKILIGFREGKFSFYNVKLISTFGVDSPIIK